MADRCNGNMRFFLHTFLFVNHSYSSPNTATETLLMNIDDSGDGDFEGWPQTMNGTIHIRGKGGLQQVLECMQIYILPVFITLGLSGSVLGAVVLLGTFLRYKFFSHFLVCLNVSSGAFLLTVFLSWLADNGIDVFGAPGLCQMHVFSSHFFTFLTVWVSVVGAYLVLWDWIRPGASLWLTSPAAAKTTVLGLSVLGFTVYSYKTWTHFSLVHKGSRVCTVIPENEPAMEILNVLDVLVLLIIPSFLFIIFVIVVLCWRLTPRCCFVNRLRGCCQKLCAKGRERVQYVNPSGGVAVEGVASGGVERGEVIAIAAADPGRRVPCTPQRSSLRRSRELPRCREVHRLVLSQSGCFLLLLTPRAVSTLIFIVHRWVYHQRQATDDILLHHIFQFSFYLYFTLLPFCPALTSKKFRIHCCSLLSSKGILRTPVATRNDPSLP